MRMTKLWFAAGLALLLPLTGCLSVARLSDLPADSASVDMESAAKPTTYGRFEHTFSLEGSSRQRVFDISQLALQQEGFRIASADFDQGCIKGERGLRANEWGMVSGIYLREGEGRVKVKVICIITQDFTGGWHQSYAQNIANRIARLAQAGR
jgi:hypothetical protein